MSLDNSISHNPISHDPISHDPISRDRILSVLRSHAMTRLHRSVVLMLVLGSGAHGQLSPAAYRVLGQIDFPQAGVNMVQGVELSAPSAGALDSRNGQLHIYI